MNTNSLLLWQKIVKDLEGKIASGDLVPGERLPTENNLAKHYQVNRHTVRRAIRELVLQNLVEVTQGRGSFVCRKRVRMDYTQNIFSPSGLDISLAKTGHGHENPVRVEPATTQLAHALQINPSDPVAKLDFEVQLHKGELLALTTRSLPMDRLPGLLDAFEVTGNLPKALERIQANNVIRKWVRTRARTASAEERGALGIALQTPLLVVGCLFTDSKGQPVLHDCSLFAADRVEVYFHKQPG